MSPGSRGDRSREHPWVTCRVSPSWCLRPSLYAFAPFEARKSRGLVNGGVVGIGVK
jgi:hypothetical protein